MMKNNKLIITADWHIRQSTPICRTEKDFIETQRFVLKQIEEFAILNGADICICGDVFHSHKDTSFEGIKLILDMAKNLQKYDVKMYALAGNHDLLYHSSENIHRSAIGVLFSSKLVLPLSEVFDSAPNFDEDVIDSELVFRHCLTFKNKSEIPPNVNAKTAEELLEETPSAKYVFVGDNHKHFVYSKNNRFVFNAGCITQQSIDCKQCGFYFVDLNSDFFKFVELDTKNEFFNKDYFNKLSKIKDVDLKIDDFVNKLKSTESISLDFVENVEKAISKNQLNDELKETILSMLEV